MKNVFNRNGLIFWNEKEIKLRNYFVDLLSLVVKDNLKKQNKAFEFIQIEGTILTPLDFINKNYTPEDFYQVDSLALRPETTSGSYEYAKYLLEHTELKTRMPLCVWQHGKSFRKEQDQVEKNMRLKEFYQLEFQCIYALNTANDYSLELTKVVKETIESFIGECRIEKSDRLPNYSTETNDIILERNNMEVCSISKRNDFTNAKVLEVAVGTDRLVYNHENKG